MQIYAQLLGILDILLFGAPAETSCGEPADFAWATDDGYGARPLDRGFRLPPTGPNAM
jgi:hypothetical protein